MCNLPVQIHDDGETRFAAEKRKSAKQDKLKFEVSVLATHYPITN